MPRTAINALWLWLGLGACYLCIRQAVQRPRDARLLVAVMCGLAAAQSTLGCYQSLWGIPSARSEFAAAADRSFEVVGLNLPSDSPVRLLFEARLGGDEPLGAFTLTNSLAGWLTPWIVLLVWIIGDNARELWGPHDASPPSSRRLKKKNQRPNKTALRLSIPAMARIAGLAAMLLVAVFTLIRTGSRTGLAACCIGVGLLALSWARRTWRSGSGWRRFPIVAGAVVIAGAFIFALARGGIASSLKSLHYRFDYWRTAAVIIGDRPWLGCGPGQFQQAYTAKKSPPAGEEPGDPHNALLEIWATAGTPAALAWIAFCGLIGLTAFRAARPTGVSAQADWSPGADAQGPSQPQKRSPVLGTASWRWSVLGAVQPAMAGVAAVLIGYAIFIPVSWMTRAVADAWLVWATLPVALLCLGLLADWVQRGRLPAWVIAVAWVALIVNLGAAGGIGFPGVASAFWMLAAIALNAASADTSTTAASPSHARAGNSDPGVSAPPFVCPAASSEDAAAAPPGVPSFGRAKNQSNGMRPALVVLALAISFGLVYACHATAYRPVLQCSAEMLAAERLSAATDPLPALAHWQAAVEADPWAFEPRAALAAAQFALWRQAPHPDRWPPIIESLDSATARAANWSAAWLWRGRLLLDAASVSTGSGAPAAPRASADAAEALRLAVKCYPASPTNWAYLALAEDRLGLPEAPQTARQAIALDADNPHRDKKLPEPLRRSLQAITLKE